MNACENKGNEASEIVDGFVLDRHYSNASACARQPKCFVRANQCGTISFTSFTLEFLLERGRK